MIWSLSLSVTELSASVPPSELLSLHARIFTIDRYCSPCFKKSKKISLGLWGISKSLAFVFRKKYLKSSQTNCIIGWKCLRTQLRYGIIYIWKIMELKVPNCWVLINSSQEGKRGRMCLFHPVSRTVPARIQSLREATNWCLKSMKSGFARA